MTIDILDMDDLDQGQDDSGNQQQPPAVPAAAPVVPAIDPAALAQQITQNVMAGLQQQFQTGANERATTKVIKDMVAAGLPPSAIELVAKYNAAAQQDFLMEQQQEMSRRQFQQFIDQAHEHAADVFDRYAEKFSAQYPGLAYAKAGIIAAYHEKLENDPAFRAEWNRMQSGKLPSSAGASKAMGLVLKDFVEKMGGAKAPPPVSLDSRKPSQSAATGNHDAAVASLDERQRKQYFVFKKGKPNEFDPVAFERARKS